MASKYIRFQWAGFVLWDVLAPVSHAAVARALSEAMDDGVVSAGFVEVQDGQVVCTGESTTLNLRSRPEDTAALRAQLGPHITAGAAR